MAETAAHEEVFFHGVFSVFLPKTQLACFIVARPYRIRIALASDFFQVRASKVAAFRKSSYVAIILLGERYGAVIITWKTELHRLDCSNTWVSNEQGMVDIYLSRCVILKSSWPNTRQWACVNNGGSSKFWSVELRLATVVLFVLPSPSFRIPEKPQDKRRNIGGDTTRWKVSVPPYTGRRFFHCSLSQTNYSESIRRTSQRKCCGEVWKKWLSSTAESPHN